ncbi:MAG: DoxX family membrane protein [Acidobacteriota bacterium]
MTVLQQSALVVLRTLIGWHLLYEGWYKLMTPGWSAAGERLAAWSAAGYLRAGTGPLAWLMQRGLDAGWGSVFDWSVKIGLLLCGLSLMLGLLTRLGAIGALVLLLLFYLTMVPLAGTHQPGTEGAYLVVNKTLIEAGAVLVILVFETGRIAGLDLLFAARSKRQNELP